MKKFSAAFALLALSALAPIAAQAADGSIKVGKTLFAAESGKRLGAIYAVRKDGTVQVIRNGKMISFPASTVSVVEGKVVTTVTAP